MSSMPITLCVYLYFTRFFIYFHRLQSKWTFGTLTSCKAHIEEILREILPKQHWSKYFKELSIQIAVVAAGLKRAFLWDIGPVQLLTDEVLLEIVKAINVQFCYRNDLCLVTLGDEKFILNQKLTPLEVEEHVFIDVSKQWKFPQIAKIHEHFIRKMEILVEELEDQFEFGYIEAIKGFLEDRIRLANMEEDDCIPAAFGILIGYPVVYCFGPSSKEENCLQGEPLIVHQMKLFDVLVMSFSVPERYQSHPEVKKVIEKWKERACVPEVTCESFERTLDVVVL